MHFSTSARSLHASLEVRHCLQAGIYTSLCHHTPVATCMHLLFWPRVAPLSGWPEQVSLQRSAHLQVSAARDGQASAKNSGLCNVVECITLLQVGCFFISCTCGNLFTCSTAVSFYGMPLLYLPAVRAGFNSEGSTVRQVY